MATSGGAPRRLVVALSGSTGPHYGVRLLEVMRQHRPDVEIHLILSAAARKTIAFEMGREPDQVASLAHVVHDERNVGASIASGTFVTDGMVVVPCSIKSLSAIANSYNDNLIARAADVCLKERRKLVLVVRETPLHLGHLRLMTRAAEIGAIIFPPAPAFYRQPQTVDEIVDDTVGRVLARVGLDNDLYARWKE